MQATATDTGFRHIDDRISIAKKNIVTDFSFYSIGVMRPRYIVTPYVQTACTDGSTTYLNPGFCEKQSSGKIIGLVAHEALHGLLRDPYRINGRDLGLWNQATDYRINLMLRESKIPLPDGALLDLRFKNMSAEQIYAILEDELIKQGGKVQRVRMPGGDQPGEGSGNGDQPGDESGEGSEASADDIAAADQELHGVPGYSATGGFTVPNSLTPDPENQISATDWKISEAKAIMIGEKAGNLPGALKQAIKVDTEPQHDWIAELWEFIEHEVISDYSWLNRDRRFDDIYLPGMDQESFPGLVVFIDSSGSVTYRHDLVKLFCQEINGISKLLDPEFIEIVCVDTRVAHVARFEQYQEVKIELHGGGGTKFKPAIDYLNAMPVKPAAALYFTDMESNDLDRLQTPDTPFLWIVPERYRGNGPFGRTVRLSKYRA